MPVLQIAFSCRQLAAAMTARSFAFPVRATPLQMTAQQFNLAEGLLLEQLDILLHGIGYRLVDPESAHIHGLERVVADPPGHDAVQIAVAQSQEGVAAGIEVVMVAVGKDVTLPDRGVDNQKPGSRGKMAVYLAIHPFAGSGGETKLHIDFSFLSLCDCSKYIYGGSFTGASSLHPYMPSSRRSAA